MINDGISLQGSYHNLNQDFFISRAYRNGWIIVVADGMGSKKMSQHGSKAICESVYEVINQYQNISSLDFKDILLSCHKEWKRKLSCYELNQCYTTMLILVIENHIIKAARLGDGFISIYIDNKVHCLYDKKSDYFINETDCLREIFEEDKIEVKELKYNHLKGAIVCSDGIEIGTMQEDELINFTKDFIEEYSNKDKTEIKHEIEEWLSDWPGCDDKTLAYILEERDKINV